MITNTTVLYNRVATCDDPLVASLTTNAMFETGTEAWVEHSLQEDVQLAAGCDVPVLVSGASGRQAEQLALAIHQRSARRERPFVVVDARRRELPAAALRLLRRDVPSGAPADESGVDAQGGTLFIAHIDEMSPAMQAALLHFLERPERRRAGVRVITACAASALDRVSSGQFRADLYYRLNLIHIAIPVRTGDRHLHHGVIVR